MKGVKEIRMYRGQPIEVEVFRPAAAKVRQKPFETRFVKVPASWIKTLAQTKNGSTWHLALIILAESFKRKLIGGEIVLSEEVTRMPGTTRRRAAHELANLGLIQLGPNNGKHTLRVLVVRDA